MGIMRHIIILALVSLSASSQGNDNWVQLQNVPDRVRQIFHRAGFDSTYAFSFKVNPFYLRGDFNGDKVTDYAVMVARKSNKKVGIAFIDGRSGDVLVCGAGHKLGNGGDNFNWLDAWQVYEKGPTSQGATELPPPELKNGRALKNLFPGDEKNAT